MAERKPDEELHQGFIFAVPVEQVIKADGSAETISEGFVVAESREAADRIVEEFSDVTGSEVVHSGDSPQEPNSGKTTFGFSIDRWNSPWEPKGPKPNWKVGPPTDPSLN